MQNYWAIVPAAGIGRRMGSATPKQYLPLNGTPILQHTLACLASHPAISGVLVALAPNDTWWPTLTLSSLILPTITNRKFHRASLSSGATSHKDSKANEIAARSAAPIYRVEGGAERCHSVLNALKAAMNPQIGAREKDWVLVHDAVRPCLRSTDIDRLIEELSDHPVGGLLGTRVRDTMKRTDTASDVIKTVDREGLWHALTPQMFRLGELSKALTTCIRRGITVTDEAQAMELELRARTPKDPAPRMVEGAGDNIKITRPDDLVLAEFYINHRKMDENTPEK
ncbi:MAG: 2-C-methyl-D-erythritol 4-phosphate cytidylyltransferase [Gammaproteobacteria bacterium]|nr:2-C-methyl-D-erythritol 4-phosphate cytidylyltransferase [Gammaproteobacteria bacterium]NNJ84073.1 2-C-methyl-D-erythritol 4-phosphate cytidylyltransferase [Gammaproteobacteria bacterium]